MTSTPGGHPEAVSPVLLWSQVAGMGPRWPRCWAESELWERCVIPDGDSRLQQPGVPGSFRVLPLCPPPLRQQVRSRDADLAEGSDRLVLAFEPCHLVLCHLCKSYDLSEPLSPRVQSKAGDT